MEEKNETLNEQEVKEEVKEQEVKEEKSSKEDKKEKKDKFKKQLEAKDALIAETNEQLAMFKDKYYRSIADLDNQRKQYEKEYRQVLKYSAQNLAEKLIPSFFDFTSQIMVLASHSYFACILESLKLIRFSESFSLK